LGFETVTPAFKSKTAGASPAVSTYAA